MRKLLPLVLLGLLPTLVSAGVYKWVDADGTVHFSDVPQDGAEKVHVPPPQTYTPAQLPPITPRSEAPPVPAEYTAFTLATPASDENIWDNAGAITVNFSVEPPLKTGRGHKLVVLLDGQPQPPVQTPAAILENVDRGSHSLQGQIVDSRDAVLMSSETITVHMHRESVLAPNRAQPTPPPKPK
ncbi:MAG: DUF4124 domain-containing protein [Gammaproteobacteria bacterium]|nr:DUF4124 domain-containing protein [Gammaproteobacteria bacterium]